MAKNLGELLKEIAVKSGVNTEDDAFKAFFATEAFATIEVPEPVAKQINTGLISMNDAKKHPDLKNFFHADALDRTDKEIDAMATEFGLSDEAKNELKAERATAKRAAILIRKVQALEADKANAGKPDQKAIQKQIDDLHAKLRLVDDEKTKLTSDFAQKEKDMTLGMHIYTMLLPHKTIHDSLAFNTKNTILKTLVNQELQDKSAKFDLDENGNVVLLRKDGTTYFGDSNQPVTAQQFIEQTLSRNKQLVTTNQSANNSNNGQSSAANNTQNGQNGAAPANASGKSNGANAAFKEIMEKSQLDAKNSTASVLGQ